MNSKNIFQKCPFCKVTKTGAEFNKGPRANGLSAYCKKCCNIKHVCKTYKISEAVYAEMIERSKGMCEICDSEPKRLVVDHDHQTGQVRGLICDTCNHFLGMIEKNPNLVTRADVYLANHATKNKAKH